MRRRSSMHAFVLALGLGACFDGEGLRGAPCLTDADCGPKFTCEGAGICGDGSSNSGARWPDSASVFCTDGTVELDTCPAPGDSGYGQDGNYQLAVPTYTEANGVVHDSVTGLDWEQGSAISTFTHPDAVDRCANLQLEGHAWRLPSRLELISLLDFGRDVPFPGVDGEPHWTSSESDDSESIWYVDFLNRGLSTVPPSDTLFVICVAGEPLVSEFSTTTDSIRDGLTGLEWQRDDGDNTLLWLEALAHCEGLELAGHSDWPLPSAKELLTLAADDREPIAGLTDSEGNYWSSSPDWPPERAVTIAMPDGFTGADVTGFVVSRVRCVRGGS